MSIDWSWNKQKRIGGDAVVGQKTHLLEGKCSQKAETKNEAKNTREA